MIATPSPTGFYKVLSQDGSPFHGGRGLPYVVGKERSVRGDLEPCERGIHVCTLEHLPQWLGPSIWPVMDCSDERVDAGDKTVLRWVVLGEPYPTWNERSGRLFATDCAEHVLPIFEREYPTDTRPRDAIAIARRYANGQATNDELAVARAAAEDAAWAAARAAAPARDAAWAAAGAAAWAAERSWQVQRLAEYLFDGGPES